MKDFDALKNIWHSQLSIPKISYEEVLSSIRKSKNSFANKLLFETIGIVTAIVLFVLIWVNTPSMMWTTHLSLLIFISCCFYYLFAQISDYRSISRSEQLLQEPEEYISYLKRYRKRRYILNTNKYLVYSTFIGVAFGLYFIEIYYSSPVWITITGAGVTIMWFVACWFLMKIYSRKEQEKIGEIIEKLENLERQFSNKC